MWMLFEILRGGWLVSFQDKDVVSINYSLSINTGEGLLIWITEIDLTPSQSFSHIS